MSLSGVAPQTVQTSAEPGLLKGDLSLLVIRCAGQQADGVCSVGCGSGNRQQELPGEKGGGSCSIEGNGSSGREPEVELPSGCMTFHIDITCTLRYLSYRAANTMRPRD